MPLYLVTMRYVVEETAQVQAPTKAEAIELAWGESDTTYERVRNYASKARIVKDGPGYAS